MYSPTTYHIDIAQWMKIKDSRVLFGSQIAEFWDVKAEGLSLTLFGRHTHLLPCGYGCQSQSGITNGQPCTTHHWQRKRPAGTQPVVTKTRHNNPGIAGHEVVISPSQGFPNPKLPHGCFGMHRSCVPPTTISKGMSPQCWLISCR